MPKEAAIKKSHKVHTTPKEILQAKECLVQANSEVSHRGPR